MNILVIATLDTKGVEAAFICEKIHQKGGQPILADPGTLGKAVGSPEITRHQIAEAAGYTLDEILGMGDKGFTQKTMIAGLISIVQGMYAQGKINGIISIGGGQGTAIATAVMKTLPVGIPKVMVSTVACGKSTFGPYVGTKDVTMIHSVADISGLNFITRTIFSQAAAAVVAMAEMRLAEAADSDLPLIAVTAAGVTTPGVMNVKRLLESSGYEVIVFHCNGIGGQSMEELIREGVIKGVIDFSPHEIIDLLYDGLMPALPGRMTAAGDMGIPQIVLPGCADMLLYEWRDDFPASLLERDYVRHTPTHTHFRTTYEELYAVAEYVASHLNNGKGPRAAVVPLGGYSMLNRPGEPLWDPHANKGYLDGLKALLNDDINLIEDPAHINDLSLAEHVVQLFNQMRDQYLQEKTKP